MAEFKHLVVVKFKEDVEVKDVLKGMEKLVSEVDAVKSFEWGQDIESPEMLRQGFTHAFLMTFEKKEDYSAFTCHPSHIEFSATFVAAIDKFVVLDFHLFLQNLQRDPLAKISFNNKTQKRNKLPRNLSVCYA